MRSISNPRQVVLVSCREELEVLGKTQAKDNIITLAWHTPLSFEPMMYGISVGKTRTSHEIITRSKSFCINFASPELKGAAIYCGRHSGAHIDKFKECGLTKEECESIDCPRIAEASAYMECEVVHEADTGDHTFFIAKVRRIEEKTRAKRLFQIEGDRFTTTQDR